MNSPVSKRIRVKMRNKEEIEMCHVCDGTGIEWVLDTDGYGDIEEPRPCSECQ